MKVSLILLAVILAFSSDASFALERGETILKGMYVSKVSYGAKENRYHVVVAEPRIIPFPTPIPLPTPSPLSEKQSLNPGMEYEFVLDPADAADAHFINLFVTGSGWWGGYNITLSATGALTNVERGGGYSNVACSSSLSSPK